MSPLNVDTVYLENLLSQHTLHIQTMANDLSYLYFCPVRMLFSLPGKFQHGILRDKTDRLNRQSSLLPVQRKSINFQQLGILGKFIPKRSKSQLHIPGLTNREQSIRTSSDIQIVYPETKIPECIADRILSLILPAVYLSQF